MEVIKGGGCRPLGHRVGEQDKSTHKDGNVFYLLSLIPNTMLQKEKPPSKVVAASKECQTSYVKPKTKP